jgi:ABC-2 type transport system ATP-binding protein
MDQPLPIPACEVRALVKHFKAVPAVANLTLSIPRGTLYALLGSNGAGKTTALRMMAGLLRPDEGEIRILNHSMLTSPREAKQHLAYLPDDPLLYGKLRPLEHLEFVASLWNVPSAVAQHRAESYLQELGLWNKRGDWIDTLSRGMRQKVALASALVHAPSVILLDEPLTGLDAPSARQVKDILLNFTREGGTVLLTTHLLDVAERLADRIGVLQSGRLLHEGSLDDLRMSAGRADATLEDVFLHLTRPVENP